MDEGVKLTIAGNNKPLQTAVHVRHQRSGPQRLTSEKEGFNWLFARLNESEPRIPVVATVAAGIQEFREGVGDGVELDGIPLFWSEIMSGIAWNDIDGTSADRYSIELLKLIGFVGDVIKHRGDYLVPRDKVIEAMVNQLGGAYMRYRCVSGRWYAENTRECSARFGVQIRLALAGEPSNEIWDVEAWD